MTTSIGKTNQIQRKRATALDRHHMKKRKKEFLKLGKCGKREILGQPGKGRVRWGYSFEVAQLSLEILVMSPSPL